MSDSPSAIDVNASDQTYAHIHWKVQESSVDQAQPDSVLLNNAIMTMMMISRILRHRRIAV